VRLVTGELGSERVTLGGQQLELQPDGKPPALPATVAPYGVVALPPASYAFVTQPNARAAACGFRR
jgi:hypothetical protein